MCNILHPEVTFAESYAFLQQYQALKKLQLFHFISHTFYYEENIKYQPTVAY